MTKNEFFHSTPKILYAYDEAQKRKEKRKDYELWRQGAYFYHAVSTALFNNFIRSKGQPAETYLEEPFHVSERMRMINAGLIEMDEEEKEYWRGKLFSNLESMQKSFEETHK